MKDKRMMDPLGVSISRGIRWALNSNRRIQDEKYLDSFGYSVYSQNDEDGIIEEIFNRIGTTNKVFIEFGVQDGRQCNTHYLLLLGWTGLWIEGSQRSYTEIKKYFAGPVKRGQLVFVNDFI